MGLGFAERRACCLLRLPGSWREGAGKDAPLELGVRPQESILGVEQVDLCSKEGRGMLWTLAGRRKRMRKVVTGARGCGVRAGGMMGVAAEGTIGEKNWGGRIVHLNVELITCKYNANDMQTSTGFLWVHSSGILFLGLRIGANLHPVLSPLPCFFIINTIGGRTQSFSF